MRSSILSISMFGSFAAKFGERPITTFGSIKAQGLIVYLLLEGKKQHPREALMTMLWPDATLKAAQVNLRQVLALIRKKVPESGGQPLLLSSRKTISLNPEAAVEVDVLTFTELLNGQSTIAQPPSIKQMIEAAALYRGDFLADFYLPDSNEFEEWVAAKRPYYRQQALTTLDTLTSHFLVQQDYAQAQTYTWRQLEIDPLRERACQQLMTALAHTGQRSSALAEYERFRQLLWDELGVEPSQETAVLHQQIQDDEIRAVVPPHFPRNSEFLGKSTQSTPRNNLPTQPTPFIGRENELAELQRFLEDGEQRLMTIVGPGGMGKTRLALALAEHNLTNGSSFANGIFFVNLAPLSEPSQMVSALADAFNFQLSGGSQDPRSAEQQILDYLRKKQMLLLMDNFEHLLNGVDLLNEILDAAPNVQILATSRERLHLHQEQVYPIQGLEFPDWETPEDAERYTAVQLFLQSAQRNQADFALDDGDDLTYLARICRSVAGMPLAIELAAAWVDTLSLKDIAAEIQGSLDFLQTEMRDMPERHRSIRASINYSWQKLAEKERDVFAACSVFRGGFTQKAGRAITGASLRTFSRLVNKSFLQFDKTNKRYQVHELMRQFGAEILANKTSEVSVRDQHSTYYLQALADLTEDLKGPRAKEAYQEITADYLNAYRAWHWGVQRQHFEQLEGALISLRLHTFIYSIREFKAAVQNAIAALENSELTTTQQLFLARLLVMYSYLGNSIKVRQEALVKGKTLLDDLAESGLDLRTVTAEFLRSSANKAWGYFGRYDDASHLFKESLTLYQELKDKWYQARVLTKLGHISSIQGQQKVAIAYYQQSLSLRKSIGDELGTSSNLRSLFINTSSLFEGNYNHHRKMMMEHLEIAREFGDRRTLPNIFSIIGATFLHEGRPGKALKYYLEGLAIVEDMGYVGAIPSAFADIADALIRLDKMKDAEPYIHKGLRLVETNGTSRGINEFLYRRSVLHFDKGHYDLALEDAQVAFSSAKKQGDAFLLATVAIWLAWLYAIKGNFKEAERLTFISLSKHLGQSVGAFELTAYLIARRDPQPENLKYAWELIALNEGFPIFHTFLPIQKLAKKFMPAALSAMPPAEIEAAKAKGRELEWESVIDDLLEKLPKLGWYVADEGTPKEKSSVTIRNNLPTQPTQFIGREAELAQLQTHLDDNEQRLITIVGPGGMGKTRLALALAAQKLAGSNSFANGIFFVNLAPLSEPSQIVSALADAFNFQLARGSQDPRPAKQQILDYLRKKQLLLLMDNFEHLLDGVDLLNEIFDVAPGVQILATSRERLHLHQEQVFPIQGLEFPDWETVSPIGENEDAAMYTAVQLFLQSAQRNQANFALGDGDDLTYLARICRLVSGMPLAIELAAAWVDTLSLADIAGEIQDSLDFLETDMRDMPERHRSIRVSINYSWQKLDKKERDVFAACSVFRGGFTQKAGRAITGASLRTYSRLVNKSFLQFDQTNKRYQVHELMRQFGAEILAENEERETAVRDQHSTHYLQALADLAEDVKGPRAKEAFDEITADYLNTYGAWHWGVQRHHFEQLNGALFSLRLHANGHSFHEYEAALKSTIATLETNEITTPQQLFLAGLWIRLSYYANSTEIWQETLAKAQTLLDDLAENSLDVRAVKADALRSSGFLAKSDGRIEDACHLLEGSLTFYQELKDKWHQEQVLHSLGVIAVVRGQQKVAESYLQHALSLCKSIGDEIGLNYTLSALTINSIIEGTYKNHREVMMQRLEVAREFGDRRSEKNILSTIGLTFLYEAHPEEALKYYLEVLAIIEDMGYEKDVPEKFRDIAETLMRLDNMKDAESYIHKGLRLAKTYGFSSIINVFLYYRSILHLDKGHYELALNDAQVAFSSTQKQGDVIIIAIVAIWLAWLHIIKGNYKEAERLTFISLSKRLGQSHGALQLTAYLLVRRDPQPESLKYAWQLLALFERFPLPNTFLPIQKLAKQTRPTVLSDMPPAEIEAAKAKGRELEWEAVIDDLLEKLPKLGWYVADEGTPQEKSSVTIRNNLPTQPTPFIGREDELTALQAYLDDNEQRLITIVGPGGMGKTRLALALAAQKLAGSNSFANGIFFVNLAPLSEPSQIVSAIADAFNFQLAGGSQDPRSPNQQILDYLRKKHLLLLMDNFEHLLDGVDLLNEILDVAPGVQILATSRERLHLHQEQVYPIQGLEFPDWETPEDAVRYTAVQLFLQSAQRNQADFSLDDGDDLTYLARICRLVAGMPLAIELAAAWVDTLPLADIATEIQESLDFLETEMRDMPERHRSIRASINYSWQKLDKKERDVFAACSVFRGGFTQKAGRAITGASLRTFSRLVNKSFLQFDSSTKRYQVHELMRQFGAEILAEDDERETAVRDQHSNYYLEALANRTEDLKGPRAKEAHQEITADYLNAYRAWHWSVQRHHFEPLDRAFFSLGYHAIKNDRNPEFEAALRSAIATMENSALTITQQLFLARLWIRLSTFVRSSEERQGALANGQALLDDLAESELDLRPVAAEFVTRSANLAVAEGRFDDALQLGKDGLILYQELNDQWHQANKLHGLGATSNVLGQQKVAESYFQQSLSLSKSIGDELGIIDNLLMLTEVSLNQGNAKHHREMVMEHLETAREFGNHQLEVSILATIGNTFLYEARPEETLKYYVESLEICEDVGYVWGILWVNISIADAHMRLDNMKEAEPYIHKGWRLAETYGSHELINQFLYLRTVLNLDKGHYDIALEDAQVAYSNAQKQGNAVMQARVAIWLAWLYVIKGNFEEAERLIFMSLSKRLDDSKGALELTAFLLVRRDPQPESLNHAWQLIALYEEFTIFHTFLPIQKVAKQYLPDVLTAMPPAEIEAAKAKGRELEWEAVIDDLLEKLPKLGWHVADEDVPQVQEKDETAASTLPKPAQLNERFVTERLFATGGHGQVYLGRDVTSGQQVIIKKLKPELAIQQPEYIARFIREGETLRQLNHPNIVKMLATVENENEHQIVMEYVAGGSLRDLLEKRPQLPLSQVLNVGLELADALSRAHHLNIIHRDLKPSNVLLAEDGTPRLTDFGIAYLTNQETRITKDNAMLGTIRYMSPEACEGEVLDGRSDIWSFGVMLYEMLTGQLPFAGETTTATLIAILNDPAPLLAELRPDIPIAFVTLIERMLVKEREARIDSVRKVAAELESIQSSHL